MFGSYEIYLRVRDSYNREGGVDNDKVDDHVLDHNLHIIPEALKIQVLCWYNTLGVSKGKENERIDHN